jgi:hypothetical protein
MMATPTKEAVMNQKNVKRTHPWRAPSQSLTSPSAGQYLPNRQFRLLAR